MATQEEAVATLAKLIDELDQRRPDVDKYTNYYRGEQRLRFASDQFRDYFAARYSGFSDNWCGVVADSPAERLNVTGIRLKGQDSEADDDSWRVWSENSCDADSGIAFVDAFVAKRTFVLVWGNPDDETTPDVTFEHPSQAVIGYEPGSRRKRRAAAKVWTDDKLEYATLYLADEVWKFQRPRTELVVNVTDSRPNDFDGQRLTASGLVVIGSIGGSGGWVQRVVDGESWPMDNPMGVVPMVELPNRPMLVGEPLSEVAGASAMQDAINLIWANLFTAADFSAFPQRIVLGAELPKIPILDENGQKIGERAIDLAKLTVDRIMWITSKDAKVAEWTATQLDNYTGVLEVAVGHLAAQTRTPQHYLVGKMANMSADALKAAETGLVKKVEERQVYFGEALKEVFALVALAQGDDAKAKAARGGTILWKDAEMRSEAQLVDALLKLQTIGFPFEFLAERYGLTPAQIDRVMQMRSDDQQRVLADPAALFGPKPEQPPVPPEPTDDPGAAA